MLIREVAFFEDQIEMLDADFDLAKLEESINDISG